MYVFRVKDVDERQIGIYLIVYVINCALNITNWHNHVGRISSARRFNANLLFMPCMSQLLKARL